MKPKNPKVKKPLFKKWWFWLIIIVFAIGVFGGNSDSETEAPTTPAAETSAEDTSPEAESIIEAEPETTNEDMKYLTETVGLEVPSAVRNDVTGNWRLSAVQIPFLLKNMPCSTIRTFSSLTKRFMLLSISH